MLTICLQTSVQALYSPSKGLKNLQTDIIELNDHLGNQGDYVAYLEKIIDEYDELKKLYAKRPLKKKRGV